MSFKDTSEALFNSCLGAFGEEVILQQKNEAPLTILGIFTYDYQLIQELGMNSSVSAGESVLEVSLSDLKRLPTAQDKITVRGQIYKIAEIKPNNEGQAKLILKKHGASQ